MKKHAGWLLLIFVFGIRFSYSQCAFDPTITGDTLLCPNDTGSLTTQVYDSYQWYKRLFGNPTYQLISGATSQTLAIDAANDAGYYFRVAATLDTCTEFSPDVLVDSWVFLLPFTIIEGDYTIGPNGELILCQGDTILLLTSMPYDTLLQWYDNGNPIAGANNDTLIVTTAGSYTWSGAPSICPNFVQTQFIASDVVVITCPSGIDDPVQYRPELESNLVTEFLIFNSVSANSFEIIDLRGNVVLKGIPDQVMGKVSVNVGSLSSGVYFIRVTGNKYQGTAQFFRM